MLCLVVGCGVVVVVAGAVGVYLVGIVVGGFAGWVLACDLVVVVLLIVLLSCITRLRICCYVVICFAVAGFAFYGCVYVVFICSAFFM